MCALRLVPETDATTLANVIRMHDSRSAQQLPESINQADRGWAKVATTVVSLDIFDIEVSYVC
jgi:hypothetical protein